MLSRKICILVSVFLIPPIFAQPLQLDVAPGAVFGGDSIDKLPLSSIPIQVTRTSGLETPQYYAILALLHDFQNIRGEIPPEDFMLMMAAAARVSDARKMEVSMNDFCRRVLFEDAALVSREDVVDIARQLVAAEKAAQEDIVAIYQNLLQNMSFESAGLVDGLKNEIHRNSASAEIDWVLESQRDPEHFLASHSEGCNKR